MKTIYGLEFASGSDLIAKWEIDPDDPKSLQLRIPSFYFSSSGRIGIGTKDPTDEITVSSTNNKFKADWLTSITCSTTNVIAYGNVSASSYSGPLDGGSF